MAGGMPDMTSERIVILLIVSFSFALILIMKRHSIPDKLRRPLAVFALFLVAVSFALMLYSFFM